MSLHFYPHENEDIRAKRFAPPEGMEPEGGVLLPLAVINLVLAVGVASFIIDGNATGVLVMVALAAGFNILAVTGQR